jgi:putative transposase
MKYRVPLAMETYHVLNRGVDGRKLFLDQQDYVRFVHDLFEFNDTAPAQEYGRWHVGNGVSHIRNRLVNIHAWCLMKNHYHLILSELTEGGISVFMRKLNGGYARGFNERHKRKGILFQGISKKILIDRHEQFLYILHYTHLNPLDYLPCATGWRERDKGCIKDVRGALKYLENYRWSSHIDYCGIKNFPSLITKELFGNSAPEYRKSTRDFLLDRSESILDLSTFE